MPKCLECAWHEHLRDHCELEPAYANGCGAWRPKKPTLLQGLACVVIILALQAFLTALDIYT